MSTDWKLTPVNYYQLVISLLSVHIALDCVWLTNSGHYNQMIVHLNQFASFLRIKWTQKIKSHMLEARPYHRCNGSS